MQMFQCIIKVSSTAGKEEAGVIGIHNIGWLIADIGNVVYIKAK